jgi:hypothetical protein
VARPAQASAARVARALGAVSRRGGVTPASESGDEAQGGLRLKHQWGGCDPLSMDRGVVAHRGGAALVGQWVRVAMAALEAAVELRQETTA